MPSILITSKGPNLVQFRLPEALYLTRTRPISWRKLCTLFRRSSYSHTTLILCFLPEQGAEFDVYAKYGGDVLRSECREALLALVDKPDVSVALATVRHGFKEAVKYYLPRLLLVPVIHVFSYFKYIEVGIPRLTVKIVFFVDVYRREKGSSLVGRNFRDKALFMGVFVRPSRLNTSLTGSWWVLTSVFYEHNLLCHFCFVQLPLLFGRKIGILEMFSHPLTFLFNKVFINDLDFKRNFLFFFFNNH